LNCALELADRRPRQRLDVATSTAGEVGPCSAREQVDPDPADSCRFASAT
jgi:hypothetical protein